MILVDLMSVASVSGVIISELALRFVTRDVLAGCVEPCRAGRPSIFHCYSERPRNVINGQLLCSSKGKIFKSYTYEQILCLIWPALLEGKGRAEVVVEHMCTDHPMDKRLVNA